VAVRRDTGEKLTMKNENAASQLKSLLDKIQSNLFDRLGFFLKLFFFIDKNLTHILINVNECNI
jgi:hypothetical protein